MIKKIRLPFRIDIEGLVLIALLILTGLTLIAGWAGAMRLRQTVAENAKVMNVDPTALIEVEQARNLVSSQNSDARLFFLMGSPSVFEKQKQERQALADSLVAFEKKHALPEIHTIIKKIESISQQEEDFFAQAMAFRAKQTESKIVGQFYQSKTIPLVKQIDENFSKIVTLQNAELAHSRERALQAGLDAQSQIPKGMALFTMVIGGLFLAMAILVLRMLRVRVVLLRQRVRLADEAKNAVFARDQVISAVTQDLKEPLLALSEIAERSSADGALIKTVATDMQSAIDDIYDQKTADMGDLTLRLEQLGVADILDDAHTMLQPLAKQRDINLQFDPVNQSVLAYVDRERVMRVLRNLIGNAVKFSPKHSRIAVKIKSDAQFVNISVVDNGPGIPDGKIAHVFDDFWQAHNTAERGAGVGLAVAKTIIEAHGGTIRAENNFGQGTTFTFSLPRRRPANSQIKKPSSSLAVVRRAVNPME